VVTRRKKDWVLSEQALERLLGWLDPDRNAAAEKYEALRARLIKVFEVQRCPFPEDAADETFNRVARRLEEGIEIENPYAYVHGVAVRVAHDLRRRERPLPEMPPPENADEVELRYSCLTRCLETLSVEHRALVLEYYDGERRAKIDNRVALAGRLSVPLNALRIRVHRVRQRLETCVRECMSKDQVK
jgi:DNA-directed RNA polymerase specialized sigma24 family protein